MKHFYAIILIAILPTSAYAHVGHIGEVLGHDHLLGAAAIGIAIALGLWGKHKSANNKKAQEDEVSEIDSEEEATA